MGCPSYLTDNSKLKIIHIAGASGDTINGNKLRGGP